MAEEDISDELKRTSVSSASDMEYVNTCGPCLDDSLNVEAVTYCGICKKHFCESCTKMHSKILREHMTEENVEIRRESTAHDNQKQQQPPPKPFKSTRVCNIKLPDDTERCHVISCSFLPNGFVLLVDNNNNNIKLLSEDKCVMKALSLPEKPHVACVVNDKMVALTMADKAVLLLTVDRQNIKIASVCQMKHDCHCIAHFKGNLFVGDSQTIYKYPMNCKKNDIFYSNISYPKSVKYFIINNEGTRMYVTNEVRGQVIVVDMEGKSLQTIQHHDLQSPRALCFGPDCIYVCGYQSSTIIKISLTGEEPVCLVRKGDGIVSPVAICYDTHRDELVIAQWKNDNVVVFELTKPSDDVN